MSRSEYSISPKNVPVLGNEDKPKESKLTLLKNCIKQVYNKKKDESFVMLDKIVIWIFHRIKSNPIFKSKATKIKKNKMKKSNPVSTSKKNNIKKVNRKEIDSIVRKSKKTTINTKETNKVRKAIDNQISQILEEKLGSNTTDYKNLSNAELAKKKIDLISSIFSEDQNAKNIEGLLRVSVSNEQKDFANQYLQANINNKDSLGVQELFEKTNEIQEWLELFSINPDNVYTHLANTVKQDFIEMCSNDKGFLQKIHENFQSHDSSSLTKESLENEFKDYPYFTDYLKFNALIVKNNNELLKKNTGAKVLSIDGVGNIIVAPYLEYLQKQGDKPMDFREINMQLISSKKKFVDYINLYM